jgi:nucleotide-binding universal stress UspA family protein
VVTSPSPATAIVTYAEQVQASAIVMGTHGRQDEPLDAIGSVAEHVVRTAPCPVVTVRRQPEQVGSAAPQLAPAKSA